MSLGVELYPVCEPFCPSAPVWGSLEGLQTSGFYLPLWFSFLATNLTSLYLFPWFFSVSFKLIALPEASVPLCVLTSTAITCLNHWCTGVFSASLDSTLKSYSFPSWASFRRNLYLSFSACLCLWLFYPPRLMGIFDLKVSTGRHLFLLQELAFS